MKPKPLRPTPRPRPASIAERLDQLHRTLVAVVYHVHTLATHVRRLDARTKEIRMAVTEMKAALAKIDAATNNIALDLKGLKDAIKPGMSDAEVAEVQGLLDAAAGKLEGIAAETPDA